MALINCPKCGKEISDKAKQCVGCGWKVELSINKKEDKIISYEADSKSDTSHDVKTMKDSTKVQTSKLQHTMAAKRKKSFLNANNFFMMVLVFGLICFMIVIWRRLDKLSAEIEIVASNRQIESEMLTNNLEDRSEKNLEDNDDQGDLEDNNEKKEISDRDSQSENVVDKNDKQVETEVNSENIVSSDEDANVENFNIEFEYADNKVSDYYVNIFLKITNKTETAISVTSQKYLFINDISIERAFAKVDEEIPPGKSALLEIAFERKKIEAAGISTINTLTCQYDIAEKVDSKNVTSGEITFEGLGINIK